MTLSSTLMARRSTTTGTRTALVPLLALLLTGACGTTDKTSAATDRRATGTPPSSAVAANAPAPTGNVITVEMITDDNGNYFKPKEIEAKPGDVLKFVLVTGVHNVHFLADSNPGVPNLPAASAFAQLPQQTIEIPVNFATGKYYFQCDPHAALGMQGHLEVER